MLYQPYVLFTLKEETTKPYLSSPHQHLLTQGALPAKTPIGFRKNLSGNALKCFPLSTLLLKTVTVSEVSLNASPVRGSWDRHCRQERAVKLNSKLFDDFENLLVPWFWSVSGEGKTPPPDSGINNIFHTHRQVLPRNKSSRCHASQLIWVIFNKCSLMRYYNLGVMHKKF